MRGGDLVMIGEALPVPKPKVKKACWLTVRKLPVVAR